MKRWRSKMNHDCQNGSDQADVNLSKALSWLLRHSATEEGVHITEDGFVNVSDMLKLKRFSKSQCDVSDIQRIVREDEKQRYSLRHHPITKELQIRANQGHSIKFVVNPDLRLITDSSGIDAVVHGTYYRHWTSIKNCGLNKMNRVHIHFTTVNSDLKRVLNSIRPNCEILIYINLKLALEDGIPFYKSVNNVILSSGDNGIILPKYFMKATDVRSGKLIPL